MIRLRKSFTAALTYCKTKTSTNRMSYASCTPCHCCAANKLAATGQQPDRCKESPGTDFSQPNGSAVTNAVDGADTGDELGLGDGAPMSCSMHSGDHDGVAVTDEGNGHRDKVRRGVQEEGAGKDTSSEGKYAAVLTPARHTTATGAGEDKMGDVESPQTPALAEWEISEVTVILQHSVQWLFNVSL